MEDTVLRGSVEVSSAVWWRVTAAVVALHLAALSFAMGPRCVGYVVSAYFAAVAVWGGVLMSARKRRAALAIGLVLSAVIQQAAFQVWRAELSGFWYALAQFFSIQVLIGMATERAIGYASHLGRSGEHPL